MNMRKFRIVLALLLAGAISVQSAGAQEKSLKFNEVGKFKIVQFTDIHWIGGDERSEVAGECSMTANRSTNSPIRPN